MEIKTEFNVGDEVVFMHRICPSDGIIDGIKIDVDCEDKTDPDTMSHSVEMKIYYKIKPYFNYEKEYIYIKPDLFFEDYEQMKKYFFPD